MYNLVDDAPLRLNNSLSIWGDFRMLLSKTCVVSKRV